MMNRAYPYIWIHRLISNTSQKQRKQKFHECRSFLRKLGICTHCLKCNSKNQAHPLRLYMRQTSIFCLIKSYLNKTVVSKYM